MSDLKSIKGSGLFVSLIIKDKHMRTVGYAFVLESEFKKGFGGNKNVRR